MNKKEEYTQIGQVALRNPMDPLEVFPAIPLFARTEDVGGADTSGNPSAEARALREVGTMFAQKFKRYIDGGGVIETARRKPQRKGAKA